VSAGIEGLSIIACIFILWLNAWIQIAAKKVLETQVYCGGLLLLTGCCVFGAREYCEGGMGWRRLWRRWLVDEDVLSRHNSNYNND
jgi:hypothetical protein